MNVNNIIKLIKHANNGRLKSPYKMPICIRWNHTIRTNKKKSTLHQIKLGPHKFKLFLEYITYHIVITNTSAKIIDGDFVDYWNTTSTINIENIEKDEEFNLLLIYNNFPSKDEINRLRKYMCDNHKNTVVSILIN